MAILGVGRAVVWMAGSLLVITSKRIYKNKSVSRSCYKIFTNRSAYLIVVESKP